MEPAGPQLLSSGIGGNSEGQLLLVTAGPVGGQGLASSAHCMGRHYTSTARGRSAQTDTAAWPQMDVELNSSRSPGKAAGAVPLRERSQFRYGQRQLPRQHPSYPVLRGTGQRGTGPGVLRVHTKLCVTLLSWHRKDNLHSRFTSPSLQASLVLPHGPSWAVAPPAPFHTPAHTTHPTPSEGWTQGSPALQLGSAPS